MNLASVNIAGRGYSSGKVLIDTGTSFIKGPEKDVSELHARLGAIDIPYTNDTSEHEFKYFFNCATVDLLPDVELTIGGKEAQVFALTPGWQFNRCSIYRAKCGANSSAIF